MSDHDQNRPVVLTIAGLDPSGGAGVIADIRTIEQLGCTAVAAITSVTFQNAQRFFGAFHQPAESVRAQVEAIVCAAKIASVKIGMLPTAEVVREVTHLIAEHSLPVPVIDPVMKSTSGAALMTDDAFEVFVTELLPLARVVTPNIPEAEKLAGMNIGDEEQTCEAAARIRDLGARAVLVKGGHLKERSGIRDQGSGKVQRAALDVLDDGGHVTVYRSKWIESPNVRGTGCMMSSALAAGLAQEKTLEDSVRAAKQFVAEAIRSGLAAVT